MDELLLTPQQYIDARLQQYRGWYDRRATVCKWRYLITRTIAITAAAATPVVINLDIPPSRQIATVLGIVVLIVVSLENLYHYRELWKGYRATEQLLGHEEVYFQTGVGIYHGLTRDEAYRALVARVESAIATENIVTLGAMLLSEEIRPPRS